MDRLEEYNLSHEDNETVAIMELLENHIADHIEKNQIETDRLLEEEDGKTLVSDNAWNTG